MIEEKSERDAALESYARHLAVELMAAAGSHASGDPRHLVAGAYREFPEVIRAHLDRLLDDAAEAAWLLADREEALQSYARHLAVELMAAVLPHAGGEPRHVVAGVYDEFPATIARHFSRLLDDLADYPWVFGGLTQEARCTCLAASS